MKYTVQVRDDIRSREQAIPMGEIHRLSQIHHNREDEKIRNHTTHMDRTSQHIPEERQGHRQGGALFYPFSVSHIFASVVLMLVAGV